MPGIILRAEYILSYLVSTAPLLSYVLYFKINPLSVSNPNPIPCFPNWSLCSNFSFLCSNLHSSHRAFFFFFSQILFSKALGGFPPLLGKVQVLRISNRAFSSLLAYCLMSVLIPFPLPFIENIQATQPFF